MGSLFEHLLTAEETEGRLGVALVTQPPGIATPLHRHTREAEAFFLLDGTMTYRAGDEVFHLDGGRLHLAAGDAPHAFRVTRRPAGALPRPDRPGHLLGLYDEVGLPAPSVGCPGRRSADGPRRSRAGTSVGPRYGLEVVGPPLPEGA